MASEGIPSRYPVASALHIMRTRLPQKLPWPHARGAGVSCALALILVAAEIFVACAASAQPRASLEQRSPLSSRSKVARLAAFSLGNFGSYVARFGRLGASASPAVVFFQTDRRRFITAVTAMSISSGAVLWQRGSPSRSNFWTDGELPAQVYDWNRDGVDDAIFFQNGAIVVADGRDGSTLQSAAADRPYSLFIFQTGQFGGPAGLVLHGRLFVTLLDPGLVRVWSRANRFSHFPLSLDADTDGEPELLDGYKLFRSNGDLLWDHPDLRIHHDASDFADTDCDGTPELAIATSNRSAILRPSGEILWRGQEFHAQHITIGNFQARGCRRQIATFDRDRKKSGIVRLYSDRGDLLWEKGGHGLLGMLSRIDRWIPDAPASLLLVSRQEASPPTIYDGEGRIVAQLPFPPAKRRRDGRDHYRQHFVQHFDIGGDGKEEIIVHDHRQLWVYRNAARMSSIRVDKPQQSLPNPRIFNATFYMGMQ